MASESSFSRAYYWRAVHRLARETGQSVSEARRGPWREYAQRERDRRSEAAEQGARTKREGRGPRGGDVLGPGGGIAPPAGPPPPAPGGVDYFPPEDITVEEPIEEVGGGYYE